MVAGRRGSERGWARPKVSRQDFAAGLSAAALMAVLAVVRPVAPQVATAAQPALSATSQLAQGATAMTAAIAKGFDFTVVSRSTLYAKTNGPKIQVPDPNDPYTVAGVADSYYLGASAARGTVSGSDYAIQMYGGATDAASAVDINALEPTLAGLVSGGKSWRNDGRGWYRTDQVPGIGLDPRTVALLPTLLKHASGATSLGATALNGAQLPTVGAAGAVADAPGLMAPDAASFTAFAQPLSFAFDVQGRLAQLTVTMRNTRVTAFDLLVVTTITFDYGHVSAIPSPAPTLPPATPSPDPTPAASQGA